MPQNKNPDLLEAFDQVTAEEQAAAPAYTAARTDPTAFSEAQKLSKSTGIPADVVLREPDAARQQDTQQRINDAVVASPALRAKITDQNFANQASDDVQNLVDIDKKAKEFGEWKSVSPHKAEWSMSGLWNAEMALLNVLPDYIKETKLGKRLQAEDLINGG